jgi:hypothetical protein
MNPKVIFYDTPGKYKVVLNRGLYRFELFGASGGRSLTSSSRGAYVVGHINLYQTQTFFAYVGEKGSLMNTSVTFNGGGGAYNISYNGLSYACSGGGATDVRLTEGEWNDIESLKSRIIVAGGGGGESNHINRDSNPVRGGSGGFLVGEEGSYSKCSGCTISAYTKADGGEQKKGGQGGFGDYSRGNNGTFGEGGTAVKPPIKEPWASAGGGGGYFGGGAAGIQSGFIGSGAGGSSFVSGHKHCSAVSSSYSSSNPEFSGYIHYSGLFFYDIFYKSGNELIESPTGELEWDYIDGAIRITLLSNHFTCKTFDYQRLSIFILTLFIVS